MKKKRLLYSLFLLTEGMLPPVLSSQTLAPNQWERFISEQNTNLISDTFRLQTFEGTAMDNWRYDAGDGVSVVSASDLSAGGTSGGKLLKFTAGCKTSFEPFSSAFHQSVCGGLSYIGQNLIANENLEIILYQEDTTSTKKLCQVKSDLYSTDIIHVLIKSSFDKLGFQVSSPTSGTKNGYYGLDSVYVFGKIPEYSLFQGKGDWNDTTAWSHLPAERHRHALIQGKVSVANDIRCDRISLDGELVVRQGKTFHVQEMNLYETSSILNKGYLQLDGKICLNRTFPEKGVWYFVSFPFDVYAEGLDPEFSLKDDSPNSGGNYIYVRTYDGKKRSEERTVKTSWTVVPESATSSDNPLFEKGKGYLLAIDEGADRNTVSFSSSPGDLSADYGKSGEIVIDIPYSVRENDPDDGWAFCGNPLPSSLPVNALNHPDLDGYVYLFNGENYTPISVNEEYELPPFSAFFLKAKQGLTLDINALEETSERKQVDELHPLKKRGLEPVEQRTSGIDGIGDERPYRIVGSSFQLKSVTEDGILILYDWTGRRISSCSFTKGEIPHIGFPKEHGTYVVWVETRNIRKGYKVALRKSL
ncbi:MAG: hypothetical protein PHG27_09160 [Massilibacteroides sp.]|nr:hypothetical protein [Massilibacteroides sp.]